MSVAQANLKIMSQENHRADLLNTRSMKMSFKNRGATVKKIMLKTKTSFQKISAYLEEDARRADRIEASMQAERLKLLQLGLNRY